ncbi:hypothetical protein QCA50_005398 [Cerrena zonata]|uniref:Uncharacterized protein n=1 Tax=Cerrena zonata TaxID=2478898 RepID=A0AAW0GES1_9APHY
MTAVASYIQIFSFSASRNIASSSLPILSRTDPERSGSPFPARWDIQAILTCLMSENQLITALKKLYCQYDAQAPCPQIPATEIGCRALYGRKYISIYGC